MVQKMLKAYVDLGYEPLCRIQLKIKKINIQYISVEDEVTSRLKSIFDELGDTNPHTSVFDRLCLQKRQVN